MLLLMVYASIVQIRHPFNVLDISMIKFVILVYARDRKVFAVNQVLMHRLIYMMLS